MKRVLVECVCCGKEFYRPKKRVDEALRKGRNQFCSKECLSQFKSLQIETNCGYCGKKISVSRNMKPTKSGLRFCSHHCRAIFLNTGSQKTIEAKLKISKSLCRKKDKSCICCGKPFKPRRKTTEFCSMKCYQFTRRNKRNRDEIALIDLPSSSQEDVYKSIQSFWKTNGFIPTSKADAKLKALVVKFWGSWNNMIRSFGITTNGGKFNKKAIKCKDGHLADSISERIVDDWLFENGIKHERGKRYPNSRCNCDFFLSDFGVWVEYFGLIGKTQEYDSQIVKKQITLDQNGLILVSIFPSDLYPENNLRKKLEWMIL